MQFLNDDMDELFRRAGEEYPLNTNGADWNKVAQSLHHDHNVIQNEEEKKNYRYLWLLLLLPLGFIVGRYVDTNNKSTAVLINKESNKTRTKTDSKGEKAVEGGVTTLNRGSNQVKSPGEQRRNNKHKANSKHDNAIVRASGSSSASTNSGNNSRDNLTNYTSSAITEKRVQQKFFDGNLKDKIETYKSFKDRFNEIGQKQKGSVEGLRNEPSISSQQVTAATTEAGVAVDTASLVKSGTSTTDTVTAEKSTGITKNKELAAVDKKATTKGKSLKGRLYYSVLFGPDVSSIKYQYLKEVGYSAGLMLGYKLTGRISLEAGVLYDKKQYYSNGEYLDTNKIGLPPHSIVQNADGSCSMIELPLNIGYNFASRTNHSWFVSAGLSTYLMQKEDYSLSYKRYNMQYQKDYGYNNSSKDWFSILNLSVGYKKSIGKNSQIQFAPYIKLPLRGVGVGRLPISSTGVYISLNRFIL